MTFQPPQSTPAPPSVETANADTLDALISRTDQPAGQGERRPLTLCPSGCRATIHTDELDLDARQMLEAMGVEHGCEVEICKVEPPMSKEDLIRTEITAYKSEPRLKTNEDPLQYWRVNACKYRFLSRLAKIYLCVQASSVPSERIFSTAGDIVTATRSCLDHQHVDQLIFLKKNFDEVKDLNNILHNT